MKQLSVAILGVLMLVNTSCEKVKGDGPVVTENRITGSFKGIDLQIDADVQVRQDAAYKIEVSAQRNILDVLDTYIYNDRLVIRYRDNVNIRTHEPVRLVVSAPLINYLRVSGSGDLNTTGSFGPGNLELSVNGSGKIFMEQVNAARLDTEIAGSGNIYIPQGNATEVKTRITGSGTIDLTNVVAPDVNSYISGSGNTRVHATQTLSATITGSGSVYYKGTPSVSTNISGSGKVVKL